MPDTRMQTVKVACTSLGTCLASLGLSVVVVTDWLQLVAALIAVLTGLFGLGLMWLRFREAWRDRRR